MSTDVDDSNKLEHSTKKRVITDIDKERACADYGEKNGQITTD